MTLFLDFRSQPVGGAVSGPALYEIDLAAPASQRLLMGPQIAARMARRNLLFVAHGFNVPRADAITALGTLDAYLGLPSPDMMIGVLWPGDAWVPVVDYPFEGEVAIDVGNRLATFCNQSCGLAFSLSFLSHSLGARVVLNAVAGLVRPARSVCLTAAAVNDDCLAREYALAAERAQRISILASEADDVLKLAFPAGDLIATLLRADHSAFTTALGRDGPRLPPPARVGAPWQIPVESGYGHGDYLPKAGQTKWQAAADFMRRAFHGQPQGWPPA